MTITIHDLHPNGFLSVDLRNVLAALQQRASEAQWEVACADGEFWAMGEETATKELEALAGSQRRIPGTILTALANSVDQVIWGEFRAFEGDAEIPWVVVRAIDSSFYEVESEDPIVIERFRSVFADVRYRQ